MKRLLLALVVVAAACSSGESSDSSTSTSTSVASPTTAPVATTGAPTSTSTTLAATTTTQATTSTTGNVLEGNWADGPLIATDFAALGWWDGSDWIDAETQGALPVLGGEDYQTIVGDSTGLTTGGPQTALCEPLELIGVDLAEPGLLGSFPGPYGVAISAPWQLQPHLYAEEIDDGTYAAFASELLSSRGLDVAGPVIKQVIRTDLEGDGVNEVLVVAEDVTPGFLLEVGDYSIAFMRKVIDGVVQTAVLEATVVTSEDEQYGGVHTIGTVADLNGDGKMEIVTDSAYFEGFDVTVREYVNDDLGPILRLQAGCGS